MVHRCATSSHVGRVRALRRLPPPQHVWAVRARVESPNDTVSTAMMRARSLRLLVCVGLPLLLLLLAFAPPHVQRALRYAIMLPWVSDGTESGVEDDNGAGALECILGAGGVPVLVGSAGDVRGLARTPVACPWAASDASYTVGATWTPGRCNPHSRRCDCLDAWLGPGQCDHVNFTAGAPGAARGAGPARRLAVRTWTTPVCRVAVHRGARQRGR